MQKSSRLSSRIARPRPPKKSSVAIVSNRLPISVKRADNGSLEYSASVGGLATGLAAYVNDPNNKWIGWPGVPTEDLTKKECEEITRELRKKNCYPVFLSKKQIDDFYNGYSNSILWPAFHDLPVRQESLDEHDRWYKAYRAVNHAFTDAVLALSTKNSTIWVHDYQLLCMPQMLREARPNAKIGYFLHIPFPSLKNFEAIPSSKRLLDGVLGSDLIGMHTRRYTKNFMRACDELNKLAVLPGQVIHGTHLTQVTDFPMGIDYNRFTRAQQLDGVKKELRKHRAKYRGLRVILTVDRLDPTKGLVERLEAYQEFLRRNPKQHGKVIMVMLATPSRTEIEEYKQLRKRVDELLKEIKDEFATRKWQPVDCFFTSIPVESVTALYQVADIAFITPIRDGMNLVAKEYIASRPQKDGILILSSTAGAAQELTDALLVNPKKPETLVEALNKAVTMPKRASKQRFNRMHEQISTHTVQTWAKSFMGNLQKPTNVSTRTTRTLTPDRREDICDSYKRAVHPVILLDYDGVLSPLVMDPAKAKPSRAVLNLLHKLGDDTRSDVAVISGRSKDDLTAWLGDLPIHMVSEHGAMARTYVPGKGSGRWNRFTNTPSHWQDDIQPILEKYAANTPGASVEPKEFSLVWHYRAASPYYAQKNLVILRKILKPLAKEHGLELHNGDKILEIKPSDVNKGSAAENLVSRFSKDKLIDFILCIGDDYTDEDMFETLPATANTVKVGRGQTAARYRVKNHEEVLDLLKKLTK